MQRFGLHARGQPKMDLLAWTAQVAAKDAANNPTKVEEGTVKVQGGEKRIENASNSTF